MRRLTRGRAATDDEVSPHERGASDPAGAPATESGPEAGAPEAATIVAAPGDAASAEGAEPAGSTAVEPAARDLPAGLDAGELAAAPQGAARRSRVRRRLFYLRHARELLLRDLGGFYYEAHRSEGGAAAHTRLLEVKARRLATLDAEVLELEERLGEPHGQAVLREPGIGGTCAQCGELHGSDARFCPRCGTPLSARARRHEAAAASAPPAPHEEQGRPTTASLWGRRRTPEPPPPPEATQAAGEATQGAGEPAPAEPSETPRGNGAAHAADDPAADAPDPTAEHRS